MPKFCVPWMITGALVIEAASADEAWDEASRYSEGYLASIGDLEMFEPDPIPDADPAPTRDRLPGQGEPMIG